MRVGTSTGKQNRLHQDRERVCTSSPILGAAIDQLAAVFAMTQSLLVPSLSTQVEDELPDSIPFGDITYRSWERIRQM